MPAPFRKLAGSCPLTDFLWCMQLRWEQPEGVQHPVLTIEIGEATLQCQGPELDEFAEAIVSEVEAATRSRFSDEAGCPEQMIVVAHCSGASTMQASPPKNR